MTGKPIEPPDKLKETVHKQNTELIFSPVAVAPPKTLVPQKQVRVQGAPPKPIAPPKPAANLGAGKPAHR